MEVKMKKKTKITIIMFLLLVCSTLLIPMANKNIRVFGKEQKEVNENNKVSYVYDKLNRLTKVTYLDGSTIKYTYDKNGNLLETMIEAKATVRPTQKLTVTPSTRPTTVIPSVTGGPTITLSPTISGSPTITLSPTITQTTLTATPTITVTPTEKNEVVLYYGNDNWNSAYIHYKIGNGNWTQVPGIAMEKDDTYYSYQWKYVIDLGREMEAEVCFSDGNGNWDSKNAANYIVHKGTKGIRYEKIQELDKLQGKTVIYYHNDNWENAYIHYKTENGNWTQVPGIAMQSDNSKSGYQWKYVIDLCGASKAEVCFNDGNGNWDSQNTNNYTVYEGEYGIKEGNVTDITERKLIVYYNHEGWENAYIHYKTESGEWTQVPGVKMQKDDSYLGYQWKYEILSYGEYTVEVCFNNGNGEWDSKYEQNYHIKFGSISGIKDGKIEELH